MNKQTEALKMAIDELMNALKLLQRFEPQIVGGDMTAWTVGLRNQLSDLQHTMYNNGLVEAIQACKEALAQPAKNIRDSFNEMLEDKVSYYKNKQSAQKPVAWMSKKRGDVSKAKMYFNEGEEILPLYTHPAPSWQGLSDDEIEKMYSGETGFLMNEGHGSDIALLDFARAIEQELKEKNNAS